jgi:hypothetical protein
VAKHWKEPLDPSRHLDHFTAGSAVRRTSKARGLGFSYFVQVVGFTFEFASTDQIRECLSFFERPIHGSSRKPVFLPEKGHFEAWHERLPARILKGSRRQRVTAALREALASFTTGESTE